MSKFTTIVLHTEPEDSRLYFPLVEGEPQGTHPYFLHLRHSKFPPGDWYFLVDWGAPNIKADNIVLGARQFWSLIESANSHVFVVHSMFQVTQQHVDIMTKLLDNNEADIVSFPVSTYTVLNIYNQNKVSLNAFAIHRDLIKYIQRDDYYKVSTYYIDAVMQLLKYAKKVVNIGNIPLPMSVVIKSPYAMDYGLYRIADGLHFMDKWDWWDKKPSESPVYPHIADFYDLMYVYAWRKTGVRMMENLLFGLLYMLDTRSVELQGFWEALIPTALYLMKVKGTLIAPYIPPAYLEEMKKTEIVKYVGKRINVTDRLDEQPDMIILRGTTASKNDIDNAIDTAKKAVIIYAERVESVLHGKYFLRTTPLTIAYEYYIAENKDAFYFTAGREDAALLVIIKR